MEKLKKRRWMTQSTTCTHSRDDTPSTTSNYHQDSAVKRIGKLCPHAGGKLIWSNHSTPVFESQKHIVRHFIKQTLTNCDTQATSTTNSFCFVIKALLESTHTHLFLYCLVLFPTAKAGLNSHNETVLSPQPNIFTIWPLQKTFVNPFWKV